MVEMDQQGTLATMLSPSLRRLSKPGTVKEKAAKLQMPASAVLTMVYGIIAHCFSRE